mmetsp:Transcript_32881/g.86816  ORF Transcript_32881/g.86816 Transcript_32881/m.86816 type:complete len:109 (+) Transcript_32881:87-413(+)
MVKAELLERLGEITMTYDNDADGSHEGKGGVRADGGIGGVGSGYATPGALGGSDPAMGSVGAVKSMFSSSQLAMSKKQAKASLSNEEFKAWKAERRRKRSGGGGDDDE